MAIGHEDRVIGGERYRVTQLGAKRGRAMLVRLVKLLGPGLAAGLGGITKGAADTESAMARGIGEALYDLAARLTEDDVAGVLDELAERTVLIRPNDVQPKLSTLFDDHFAGRYDEMIQWAAFALEVNFRSFFVAKDGGAGLWPRLQGLLSFQSPSPTA